MRFGIREFVLLGILLAMPLSSYWLVFRPQNQEIEQAEREIEHKRAMLEKLQVATSRNDTLEGANEEIRQGIAAIEERLPTGKEIDTIVREVSRLAIESGLEQPGMTSGTPIRGSLYWEQPIDMTLKGEFDGFYEFLLALEQMPRITRIPDMEIIRSRDRDGHLEAEFTLSIYFEGEGESS
ncbi:MAG: type 4a pilus biogenesis protein PilO [Phycisphaerales bacterium JB061]